MSIDPSPDDLDTASQASLERHDHPASVLTVTGVSKSYGAVQALQSVTLTVRPGEIHALCGHNGAGKSTLMRILGGLESPDAGEITVAGRPIALSTSAKAQAHGIALVDQEVSVVPTLSVAENLLLGTAAAAGLQRPRRNARHARELLARVGLGHLHPATPASQLSIGERQRLEIARCLGRDARVLILDEPTATLTDAEIATVFTAVREIAANGTAVIYVSHRLGEILDLCHTATVMRDGHVISSTPTHDLTRRSLIQAMLGEVPARRVRHQLPSTGTGTLLRINTLRVPGAVGDFTLDVAPGEVVGVAGQVGSGATEIVRALAGMQPGALVEVTIDGRPTQVVSPTQAARRGIHFVSKDRKAEGLFLQRTVGDNLVATRLTQLSRLGLLPPRRTRSAATGLGERSGLTARLRSRVGQLSGGNQQKAFVGRTLDNPRLRILLLDDPTRGVDVGGRAEIHDLIRYAANTGVAVVFTSTELDEVIDLADTVITVFAGRIVSARPSADTTAAALLADMTHGDEPEAEDHGGEPSDDTATTHPHAATHHAPAIADQEHQP